MKRFRKQHEQLRAVILRVLRPSTKSVEVAENTKDSATVEHQMIDMADANAVQEVDQAYENFKEIDPLDVSKEGVESWEIAGKRYGERIDRVETRITARLRDQLGTAKNANEMFRIFSRFNALFVRPRIRGAIREYQKLLIGLVKEDIESLHDKFKVQYPHSKASKMSKVRDLPPLSGSIIWAKEIERQLRMYLHRVEDVLGKDWENHIEGQGLKADGDSFRQKLNTQEIFDDWSHQVQKRALLVVGRIFAIDSLKARGGPKSLLKIRVNFTRDVITLAKEVRNLKWLGFRVPLAIVRQANDANQYYPFAISLIESVKTYEITNDKVFDRGSMSPLVSGVRRDIQSLMSEGIGLEWQSYKLMPYVMRLSEAVTGYQEKVDELMSNIQKIDIEVQSLAICAFKKETFQEILSRIQKAIDDLNLHSYSNLSAWVRSLDEQVESKLAARLQAGMKEWIKALRKENEFIDDDEIATHRPGGLAVIKSLRIEFNIRNQVIGVHPPVEKCREHLYNEYGSWVSTITGLQRIQSQRYQVGVDKGESEKASSYHNLLNKLPDTASVSSFDAYGEIESTMSNVKKYCEEWLSFQSLWDLEMAHVIPRLKTLENWMMLLNQIKQSRTTFDTTETNREFGPIVVDFNAIQNKVNLKYDTLQKAIVQQFGTRLGEDISDFFTNVSKARTELEQQSLEVATTAEAVTFITYVQGLKRRVKAWERNVDIYRDGQKILERQRYQFPSNWLYSDNIDGEWGAFSEILKRKDGAIQTQVSTLQHKIVTEDQSVEERSYNLLAEWDKGKPVGGNTKPEEAITSLMIFEGKFSRLKDDRDNIQKAKEALELIEPGTVPPSDERVQVAMEELSDFKAVWSELEKIWNQVDQLKEQPWVSIQPRKLRQSLNEIVNNLKALPARMRQYAGFDFTQKMIKGYLKINVLIVELKSEALKERHWKQLMRKLSVKWMLNDLTLGHIWDCNLQKNEAIVRDIINIAQGEMALEEFLKQVREAWQTYELELINYQNRCKLIRGWDDLFEKVKEHINSVSAMKLSPYYKVFEEDAMQWDRKSVV